MKPDQPVSEHALNDQTLSRSGTAVSSVKWIVLVVIGLTATFVVLGVGGFPLPSWLAGVEISQEEPFASFIGQDFRVSGPVTAVAWNDFPDKAKILTISLMPSPGAKNRFVSYGTPIKIGQRVRVLSAWRQIAIPAFTYHYFVSVPDAGLPEGVPVTLSVSSSGVPDASILESMQSNSTPHPDAGDAPTVNQGSPAPASGGRER